MLLLHPVQCSFLSDLLVHKSKDFYLLNSLVLFSPHPPQSKSLTFKTSLKSVSLNSPLSPYSSPLLQSSHTDVSFSSFNAPSFHCLRPCSRYLGPPSLPLQLAISNLTFRLGLVYYHFLRVPSLSASSPPYPHQTKIPHFPS